MENLYDILKFVLNLWILLFNNNEKVFTGNCTFIFKNILLLLQMKYFQIMTLVVSIEIVGNILRRIYFPAIFMLLFVFSAYFHFQLNIAKYEVFVTNLEHLPKLVHYDSNKLNVLSMKLIKIISFHTFLVAVFYYPYVEDIFYLQTVSPNGLFKMIILLNILIYAFFFGVCSPIIFTIYVVIIVAHVSQMEHETNDLHRDVYSSIYQKNVFRTLKKCLIYCSALKRLSKELSFLSTELIILLFLTGCGIYISSIVYLLQARSVVSVTRLILTLTQSLIISAPYVCLGQALCDKFEKFYDTVLNFPWTYWNINNRKTYIIVVLCTQKIQGITFSNLINVDFRLATQMLSRIYGLLSFLKNVGNSY